MKVKGLQEQVKAIEDGKIHFKPLTMEMLEEFCLDIEREMNRKRKLKQYELMKGKKWIS